ncbi:hypothetical protein QJS04_geneDACA022662 [Acorus gramineus]|uniref:Uncharacterized protein n=1 Tax=Acorus gramineus TaxID=55184 RepID=A0AAV9B5B9_ACOGR|nr:hypothetical protein QJS04_geneDACA022662 [Acorus gramineus]
MITGHLRQGNPPRTAMPLGIYSNPMPDHGQASTSRVHATNAVKGGVRRPYRVAQTAQQKVARLRNPKKRGKRNPSS